MKITQRSLIAELQGLATRLKRNPDLSEFTEHLKITEWDIRKNCGGFPTLVKLAGLQPSKEEATKLARDHELIELKKEIKALSRENEELHAETANVAKMRAIIGNPDAESFGDSEWLKGARSPKGTTGIPTLFLSDIHFDEVVHPEQIEHVNAYNNAIARKRIQHTFQTTIDLLRGHISGAKYDGIVCALGGDMLSGNIHEELKESNEKSINRSVFELADLLITGIGGLADEFGRVFVPCVVGNHGRHDKKPRAKNRVFDNHEWVIYQLLARYFASDSRVSLFIPDGADARYTVYEKNFLLTHGDQFKGGSGIAGIFSPLMLGMARKQKRQQAVQRPFDYMMMGHWHQLMCNANLIINGSIKGYDEYAYISNFGFEQPRQALFVMHPELDMTFWMPVLCNGYEKKTKRADTPKITW